MRERRSARASAADETTRRGEALWSSGLGDLGRDGVVAILALLATSELFQHLWQELPGGAAGLAGLRVALFLYMGLALHRHAGTGLIPWLARRQPALLLLLALALLSALWSLAPERSLACAATLLATTTTGIFLGYRFASREAMRVLFWALIIALGCNLLATLLLPEYGVSKIYGRGYLRHVWQGLTDNKNVFGGLAALAALLFVVGTVGRRIESLPGIVWCGLALVAVILAQAATAQVALSAALALLLAILLAQRLRVPPTVLVVAVIGALGVAAVLVAGAWRDQFAALLERDADFTNRTQLWADAIAIIADQPWTGYGYGAVWGLEHGHLFPETVRTAQVEHAHNGFLNLATELGLPAALLAFAQVLATLARSLRAVAGRPAGLPLFAACYTVLFLVGNMAESKLYVPVSLDWMVFVALMIALARLDATRPAARRRARRHLAPQHDGSYMERAARHRDRTPQSSVPGNSAKRGRDRSRRAHRLA
jgi:exopolysaccharide production protein ExoQ